MRAHTELTAGWVESAILVLVLTVLSRRPRQNGGQIADTGRGQNQREQARMALSSDLLT